LGSKIRKATQLCKTTDKGLLDSFAISSFVRFKLLIKKFARQIMEEKLTLNQFIKEVDLLNMNDLDELKEICITTNKYLESRSALVKQKELEIFKKTLKLMEAKSKYMEKLTNKEKELQNMNTERDKGIENYLSERLLLFDMQAPQTPPQAGPRTLTLRDAQGHTLQYELVFSPSQAIISVLTLPDKTALPLPQLQALVHKLKSFCGNDYFGYKKILIELLESYIQATSQPSQDHQPPPSPSSPSFFHF